jgi:hypothetical protein
VLAPENVKYPASRKTVFLVFAENYVVSYPYPKREKNIYKHTRKPEIGIAWIHAPVKMIVCAYYAGAAHAEDYVDYFTHVYVNFVDTAFDVVPQHYRTAFIKAKYNKMFSLVCKHRLAERVNRVVKGVYFCIVCYLVVCVYDKLFKKTEKMGATLANTRDRADFIRMCADYPFKASERFSQAVRKRICIDPRQNHPKRKFQYLGFVESL